MPTKIRVKVVNIRTGDTIILERIIKREFPKSKGRWIAYAPKVTRIRRAKNVI